MIKSIYFMFLYVPACSDYLTCSAKAQDKFKNLSSDDFENLYKMKTYRE